MDQPKVFEFAKQLGMETIALMDKIKEWKLPIKNHMAALDDGLISEIKTRLEQEKEAKDAKKGVKKKIVKKAVPAKAAGKATEEATPSKKSSVVAPVKAAPVKTVAPKAPAKKVVAAPPPKSKKTGPSVIRRKAGEVPETFEAKMEAMEAEAREAAALESQSEETGVPAPTEGVEKKRGNIVGRMDLKRVQAREELARKDSGAASATGPGGQALRPKATGPRNLRAGFVSSNDFGIDKLVESEEAKKEKLAKKKAGGGDEVEIKFSPTEFRKREVVFQPKKKKIQIKGAGQKTMITTPKATKRVIRVFDTMTVGELSDQIGVKAPVLIKKLMSGGVMATMNTGLDFDTISLMVPEFGFEAINAAHSEDEIIASLAFGDLEAEMVGRPPVVTVMGHVDHGKTSLLDAIRKANVASKEAGGITQHIGAYQVNTAGGNLVSFIDTPGHEAFTAMRARGANVTDIAIIVVAADDGVMPQTAEAISHAKAAGVPIIIAMNKMDKSSANPDRIKNQMTEFELVPEEWGGSTMFMPVSATTGAGIPELLEAIMLVAEVQELKANPKRSATGTVIESRLEKGKGHVATLLIKDGTLEVGQLFVAGQVLGRIRSMTNDKGELLKTAGPSQPVEVTGLEESPAAGDRFDVCKDEVSGQRLVSARKRKALADQTNQAAPTLEQIFSKVKAGDFRELGLVIKADVMGSLEAIRSTLEKLKTEEVSVKMIHTGIGAVNESDVLLAATSGGMIIGFNVRPDANAARVAKERKIEIKTYSVIYNLSDDIKKAMSGLLKPSIVDKDLGRAQVRETFTVPKIGTIAGCAVTEGKITRNSLLRLVRDGRLIYEGRISSLRRFKDDAKEVASGFECGIGIENFNDIKVGDVIEAFTREEVGREL